MKNLQLAGIGLICSILLLSACVGQKTPQEVAQAFWESVIRNDSDRAVKYSTLTEARDYDSFSRNWSDFRPSLGRVVIDGDEANIATEVSRSGNSGADSRKFVTYLVRQDDEWKVDYSRTGRAVRGGALASLFAQLDQLGNEISDQFRASSNDLSEEMARMNEQFAELSETIGQRSSETLRIYGRQLRRSIRKLADSVQRALEEQEKRLSDRDRRVLTEVVSDLDEGSENLSEPTIQSITEAGESVGTAQRQLASTDDDVVGQYKEQWREWEETFAADMRKAFEELSMSEEDRNKRRWF